MQRVDPRLALKLETSCAISASKLALFDLLPDTLSSFLLAVRSRPLLHTSNLPINLLLHKQVAPRLTLSPLGIGQILLEQGRERAVLLGGGGGGQTKGP